MKRLNPAGFTLIELMLAMSLFISVMVVATVGFVGINRTFSKGLAQKALSEQAQKTVEDMTSTVRSNGATLSSLEGKENTLCSSTVCYVWGNQLGERGGLYKVLNASADTVDQVYQGGVELFDQRFFVAKLNVTQLAGSELVRIEGVVHSNQEGVVEGDSPDQLVCKGSAQEGASRNCALEKFEFVVSTAIKGPEPGENI